MSSQGTKHKPQGTPWRIGHRGAAGTTPENTLLSFRRAIELGCDGVECDVHACKDGTAVVIHDDTLKRTTGGKGKVADHTLIELQKFDAGRGERIPSLEEMLAEIAPRATVFIEIKDAAAVLPVTAAVTHFAETKGLGYARLPVISFGWDWLLAVKAANPKIRIGATPDAARQATSVAFVERAAAAGMWSVNPCIDFAERDFVDAARARGLKVVTWTANSPAQIEKARALGVDGIVSDFPERF